MVSFAGLAERVTVPEWKTVPQAEASGEPKAASVFRMIENGLAVAPTVSVVVPAKNEAPNLAHVFASIPSWVDEVVLVDGHSVDDTVAEAQRLLPDARIVSQQGHG